MPAPEEAPLASLAALWDPRRLRELWLGELRRFAAEYIRSPTFLALAKFNLSLLARPTTLSRRPDVSTGE